MPSYSSSTLVVSTKVLTVEQSADGKYGIAGLIYNVPNDYNDNGRIMGLVINTPAGLVNSFFISSDTESFLIHANDWPTISANDMTKYGGADTDARLQWFTHTRGTWVYDTKMFPTRTAARSITIVQDGDESTFQILSVGGDEIISTRWKTYHTGDDWGTNPVADDNPVPTFTNLISECADGVVPTKFSLSISNTVAGYQRYLSINSMDHECSESIVEAIQLEQSVAEESETVVVSEGGSLATLIAAAEEERVAAEAAADNKETPAMVWVFVIMLMFIVGYMVSRKKAQTTDTLLPPAAIPLPPTAIPLPPTGSY
jgi:hypothetical protein